MSFRQMVPFLLLNVLVSAAVVLGVLFWWDGRNEGPASAEAVATEVAQILPTADLSQPLEGAPVEAAPEAVAEGAVEEAAVDGPPIHRVAAGDTLGSISDQFDVTMEDIMAANGITDPNFLSVGQELIIPVGGLPEPTVEVIETVALPSPIPTAEAAAAGETALEITTVEGTGTLEGEALQIVNSGPGEQAMAGWRVRDEDGNVYAFGQIVIFGEGAGIWLHSGVGQDTATDLYWGLEDPAWRSGEIVTLWNAADEPVGRFTVP